MNGLQKLNKCDVEPGDKSLDFAFRSQFVRLLGVAAPQTKFKVPLLHDKISKICWVLEIFYLFKTKTTTQ
jgi:hypothetical protein